MITFIFVKYTNLFWVYLKQKITSRINSLQCDYGGVRMRNKVILANRIKIIEPKFFIAWSIPE
jgi:hypothetical protein